MPASASWIVYPPPCRDGRASGAERGRLHPVQQAMVDFHGSQWFWHAGFSHVALRVVDALAKPSDFGDREGFAGQSVPLHRL